jgi:hypothetical protein
MRIKVTSSEVYAELDVADDRAIDVHAFVMSQMFGHIKPTEGDRNLEKVFLDRLKPRANKK